MKYTLNSPQTFFSHHTVCLVRRRSENHLATVASLMEVLRLSASVTKKQKLGRGVNSISGTLVNKYSANTVINSTFQINTGPNMQTSFDDLSSVYQGNF